MIRQHYKQQLKDCKHTKNGKLVIQLLLLLKLLQQPKQAPLLRQLIKILQPTILWTNHQSRNLVMFIALTTWQVNRLKSQDKMFSMPLFLEIQVFKILLLKTVYMHHQTIIHMLLLQLRILKVLLSRLQLLSQLPQHLLCTCIEKFNSIIK